MYPLHDFPAHANTAPHMVLEELGVKCELLLVDRTKDAQKSREYLKINPNGRIPTLVDNNLVLSEARCHCAPARLRARRHHRRDLLNGQPSGRRRKISAAGGKALQ